MIAGATCLTGGTGRTGNGAYVLCTVLPSLPLPFLPFVLLSPSPCPDRAAESLLATPFPESLDDPLWLLLFPLAFFDCLAELKMPSGTTRSRRKGIESIVLRLPSVDFVK